MRFLWFFLVVPFMVSGQHATIKGVAPLAIGEEIQLRVNDDPISGKERVLAKQKIDVDGSFELKVIPSDPTQYAFLQVGTDCADFYIERNKDLELSFVPPKEDPLEPKAFNERRFFIPKITGGAGKKLNHEISAFNDSLDAFLESIYPILKQRRSPKLVAQKVEEFNKQSDALFADAEPFAKDYITYSVAGIEQTFLTDRERLYEKYLKGVKPNFHNPAFTSFLIQYYQRTVHNLVVVSKHQECVKALNGKEAFAELDKMLLASEPSLENAASRRLVLIEGLDGLFGQPDIEDEKLVVALKQFGMLSANSNLGNAARNIAEKHEILKTGAKAPELLFTSSNGDEKRMSELFGQYIFLELTDATNIYSNRETNVIPNLKADFKDVRFVTICVGNSEREMLALKRKMGIDWELGRIPITSPAIEDYQIKSLPLFFIIDPDGNFYSAPAKDPTKGAQQELMSLNEKLKVSRKWKIGR